MRKLLISCLIALPSLMGATSAVAERSFPQRAVRGEMKAYEYPYMKIGDKTLRLAPGSRIFNHQNQIIMPASLQKQSAQVMFAVDFNGDLSEVWLLTGQEAALHPLKRDNIKRDNGR